MSAPGSEETDDAPIPALAGASAGTARRLLARPEEILCFCSGTTTSVIARIVQRTGTHRVQDITRACGAGGACNSCRADIAAVLQALTGKAPDMTYDFPTAFED